MKNLSPPFGGNIDKIRVVGSINGLVCLGLKKNAKSIVLWNPAIREYFQIPKPLLVLKSDFSATTPPPARVEIYNTRTNAWRKMVVDGFPWLIFRISCHTVTGGAAYWCAIKLQLLLRQDPRQNLLVWFDAADECFRFHRLPSYDDISGIRRMSLGGMGEHPGVIVYSTDIHQNAMVDIWELSGKDVLCWKKKSMVEPFSGMERVLGCWRNREIIGEDKQGSLFIYDPHPKQIEGLPSCGSSGSMEVYGYTESLLSPSRLA